MEGGLLRWSAAFGRLPVQESADGCPARPASCASTTRASTSSCTRPGGWIPASRALDACGGWTAADLARHVLAVAGWYHEWLDRAEHGDADPPFGAADLAVRNAEALAPLSGLEGPTALAQFVERARTYRDRLPARWDLPFGYPRGTVTAGLHAGGGGLRVAPARLGPCRVRGGEGTDPVTPSRSTPPAGECLAVAEGGVKGRVAALLVPLGTRLRPWEAVLRRSGRAPGPGGLTLSASRPAAGRASGNARRAGSRRRSPARSRSRTRSPGRGRRGTAPCSSRDGGRRPSGVPQSRHSSGS